MNFFVELLMRNWKTVLIATVIASCLGFSWLQTTRLNSAKAELAEIQRVSDEATQQTEANLETIRQAIPAMVETAQRNAVANFTARYGIPSNRCVACPVANGMRQNGDGQAASAARVDATSTDAVVSGANLEFVQQCAETTALYNAWRELCRTNTLTCEVK
jgi:hypothetical protein